MTYLMDSSALIQAKNHFYRFSFCPGFWEWIVDQHVGGGLFSVIKVEEELKDGTDELSTWAVNSAPSGFFIAPSPQVVTTQGVVARWVNVQTGYSAPEKARFLGRADPWLIAEAIVSGYEIITFEESVRADSQKVKIPNVAANFGVKCAILYDVFEGSGALLKI